MGFPVICRLINTLLFDWLIRNRSGVSKRVCLVPSSETQGQSVESGEKARECFQAMAEEPLGTDSHRTISKRSSECWLLIGHKKYDCAQSANSIDCYCLIKVCLAHAPKKSTQSGNFQFDINSPFQSTVYNTVYPKTKTWKRM